MERPKQVSRDQVAAILRQRAERNVDFEAALEVVAWNAADPPQPQPHRQQRLPMAIPPPQDPRVAPGGILFPPPPPPLFRQASIGGGGSGSDSELLAGSFEDHQTLISEEECKSVNISVSGNLLAFSKTSEVRHGIFVHQNSVSKFAPFFEIEIVKPDSKARDPPQILIGLCSKAHSTDVCPGWAPESVAFHCGEGSLYRGRPRGQPFGPRCEYGDRVACGIRNHSSASGLVNIYFTRNGKEIGNNITLAVPPGGFYPVIGLLCEGQQVFFSRISEKSPAGDESMVVDGSEEEWPRLHDIKMTG